MKTRRITFNSPVVLSFVIISFCVCFCYRNTYCFIISCDKITGCAVIFYPGLMHELARKLDKNPTILICEPGKVYVFESGKRKKKIRSYVERYRNYIGDLSFELYLFFHL